MIAVRQECRGKTATDHVAVLAVLPRNPRFSPRFYGSVGRWGCRAKSGGLGGLTPVADPEPLMRRLTLLVALVVVGCQRSEKRVVVYCAQDPEFAERVFGDFGTESGLTVAPKFDS